MSTAIQDFKQLPVSERIQIVEDLWDTIADEPSAIGLTPAHIEELDRRLDSFEILPEAGTAWNVARERILACL